MAESEDMICQLEEKECGCFVTINVYSNGEREEFYFYRCEAHKVDGL